MPTFRFVRNEYQRKSSVLLRSCAGPTWFESPLCSLEQESHSHGDKTLYVCHSYSDNHVNIVLKTLFVFSFVAEFLSELDIENEDRTNRTLPFVRNEHNREEDTCPFDRKCVIGICTCIHKTPSSLLTFSPLPPPHPPHHHPPSSNTPSVFVTNSQCPRRPAEFF